MRDGDLALDTANDHDVAAALANHGGQESCEGSREEIVSADKLALLHKLKVSLPNQCDQNDTKSCDTIIPYQDYAHLKTKSHKNSSLTLS